MDECDEGRDGMDGRNYETVEIFGEEYKLVSDHQSDHLRHLASIVDDKMHAVANRHPNYSKTKVAILVGLNLADELLRLEDENQEAMGVEEKISHLNSVLEKFI